MSRFVRSCLLLCLISLGSAHAQVPWGSWSDEAFARARAENRFVLLDLEAVWCHWCHVMERETYHDPKVMKLIASHYVPIKVDQDARPDISRRYENYGWPATIVFAPDGTEIVKRRGYIAPEHFANLLQAIIDDPSPVNYPDSDLVTEFSTSPLLAETTRAILKERFVSTHDFKKGGMLQQQKFMDRDTVEYALMLAARGDAQAAKMATQTLNGALQLIDPVWGGVYQYSTHSDWKHAHFEKIMFVQADYMRVFVLAYETLGDPKYLQAARDIERYVDRFLRSPEGAFYTSQDADLVKGQHSEDFFALDDAKRMKLGIPAIDKHRYARENGWMIHALTYLYAATGEAGVLDKARQAARWVLANRALSDGGFRHDEKDPAGPYLEDTLSMGRAFLGLHQVTGEREWLEHAMAASQFIRDNFSEGPAGFVAGVRDGILEPQPQTDENLMHARFAALLAHYSGDAGDKTSAERAMRYLVTPEIALRRRTNPGILIADIELSSDPAHLAVIGAKNDPAAARLFRAAQRYPGGYKRIEWWDRAEGPLTHADIDYPPLPRAAAFVCSDGSCSLPIFDAAELLTMAARINRN